MLNADASASLNRIACAAKKAVCGMHCARRRISRVRVAQTHSAWGMAWCMAW